MAASNSASASTPVDSPTVPRPRPSVAPTTPEVEALPSPAGSAVSVDSPVYSPTAVTTQLNASQAFNVLMATDPPEFTAGETNKWWAANPQLPAYSLFAPSWCDAVRQHTCVHNFSLQPNSATPAVYSTYYLHSTKRTMTKLFSEGDLKSRYLFGSALQCCLHQVAHDHFELSNSKLAEDSIVLQLNVKDDFVTTEGRTVVNGFVERLSSEQCRLGAH
eukprot:2193541-Amphidinium_carterae.1